jgi:hypothetical protein
MKIKRKNKHVIALLFLFLCFTSLYSQNYYWNRGEKTFVEKNDHKNFYLFRSADRTIGSWRSWEGLGRMGGVGVGV